MKRQIVAGLCSAIFGSLASVSLATNSTNQPSATGDRQIYSSIKELMESIVDPSADVLWQAVGTVVDKAGFHDALPKTAKEWLDVRNAAVRIVEGGNLLMMRGRQAAPAGTKSEVPGVELEPAQIAELINTRRQSFDGFARALQLLGLEAVRASDSHNGALLMDIGGRMENVCESCHQTFWYPNASNPSRGQPSVPRR